MNSEPQKETTPENQERSEREATFSRRGLLQWSVPAILAVSLPGQVSAGSMGHTDTHDDHRDHGHTDTHGDMHDDGHQDMHEDSHTDTHGDMANRPSGGKGSGQVPNFSTTAVPAGPASGAVPNYGAGSSPGAAPSQGGSGAVPKYTPPARK